jgi:HAD superfamily hydrolase (TIGR01509 family)
MLTIFDCDGVLIDSEIIDSEVTAELLTAEGYEITADEMAERFTGMMGYKIAEIIEEELGRRLPSDLKDRCEDEINKRLRQVPAIEGVADLLDQLDGPRCVCSSSASARLKVTLTTAGLYDRFKPYVFSAREVGDGRGKPAPDVFLHAAKVFEVAPRQVLVIEDSVAGVQGAVAAGMRVIGFTGGSHSWQGHADHLTEAGAETVVRRMKDMHGVIEAMRSWGGMDA